MHGNMNVKFVQDWNYSKIQVLPFLQQDTFDRG